MSVALIAGLTGAVSAGVAGAGQITQARTNVDCGPKPWFGKEKKAEWQACVNKSLDVKSQMIATQASFTNQEQSIAQTEEQKKQRRIKMIAGIVIATVILIVVVLIIRSRRKK
jgi:predicted nucleic acid-binding Zn ribbon protein